MNQVRRIYKAEVQYHKDEVNLSADKGARELKEAQKVTRNNLVVVNI